MQALMNDIQELILNRLTDKQLEKWNSSNLFYDELLPKITKAKWAKRAIAEIDRRCEYRLELQETEQEDELAAFRKLIRDKNLRGFRTARKGLTKALAYKVVNTGLKPGRTHAIRITEIADSKVFVETTDGWEIDVVGWMSIEQLKEFTY